jgi:peptidoglycan/xylan/chitin deacetylase (PgdA/CDA1 family)
MKKLVTILLMLCTANIWGQKIPKKVVVLTFDDAVLSHYTNVAPLLRKYHFNATFYICEFPGYPNPAYYMNWDQVKQLSDQGFEIGNHSWHHAIVTTEDETTLRRDIACIEHKCDSLHIPKPTTFAYPSYVTDEKSLKVLKDMGYATARIGSNRFYDPGKDNPLLIPSYSMVGEDSTNKKLMQQAWDESAKGNLVIITIHGVPDLAHPFVSTPLNVFAGYLKYLHDNHYKVISMKELAKYQTK